MMMSYLCHHAENALYAFRSTEPARVLCHSRQDFIDKLRVMDWLRPQRPTQLQWSTEDIAKPPVNVVELLQM